MMRQVVFLCGLAIFMLLVGSPAVIASSVGEPKLVAITFDDLPFANATTQGRAEAVKADQAIRRVLARHRVPATGFVTEKNVQALGKYGPSILRGWLRDGLDLGNHGGNHISANSLDIAGVRQEIVAGEATLAPIARQFNRPVTFYRFAYNHLGDSEAKRSAIDGVLAEHGYRLAASTIDTSDYLFDQAYTRAVEDKAMRQRIEVAYLDHSRIQIRYYQGLNRQALGREPPAIMLLHSNRLNAATLDRLLAVIRSEGFAFVSLTQAQADPAYKTAPVFATQFGPMWGYRWARERRVPVDGSKEEEPPAWLKTYAETGAKTERL
jgi:peptidoglycan/xylan/chitin deacetylase (PgdA/CDA1 family)